MDERRREQRADVRVTVRVYVNTIGEFMQSYSQNLSTGGMMLKVDQAVAKGDSMGVEFRLKSEYPLISARGTIQWVRPAKGGSMVGIKFEDLDDNAKRFIADAIKLQKQSAGEASGNDDFLQPPHGETLEVEDIEELDGDIGGEMEELTADFGDIQELDSSDVAMSGGHRSSPLEADSLEELDLSDLSEPVSSSPAPDTFFAATDDMTVHGMDHSGEQASFGFEAGDNDELTLSGEIDLTRGKGGTGGNRKFVVLGIIIFVLALVGGLTAFFLGGNSDPVAVTEDVANPQHYADAATDSLGEMTGTVAGVSVDQGGSVSATEANAAAGNGPVPAGADAPGPSAAAERRRPERGQEPEAAMAAAEHSAQHTAAKKEKVIKAPLVSKTAEPSAPKSRPLNAATTVEQLNVSKSGTAEIATLVLDREDPAMRDFAMRNPPRYIVDFPGAEKSELKAERRFAGTLIKKARVGKHPDKIRIVFDMGIENYRVEKSIEGRNIKLRFIVVP